MCHLGYEGFGTQAFVKNDVALDPEQPHMILLGLNGSGKSVLLKSVGTAVIMAQAGMFVPCSELIFGRNTHFLNLGVQTHFIEFLKQNLCPRV